MSTELVISQTTSLAVSLGLDEVDPRELLSVLKATAFKGQVTDAQMTALLIVSKQYGLNPWTKEIYAFPDKNNGIVPVVGVDGWSRIINNNPQFDGMDFEQDDESCTCVIYRKDRGHPIRVTEYMSECRRNVGPWQSHPKRMLRHKAMIQCARLAFGFVGIYEQDEAERIIEGEFTNVPRNGSEAASQAVQRTIPADSPERDAALKEAENEANKGTAAFNAMWGEWTKDKRLLVTDQMKRFKDLVDIADARIQDEEQAAWEAENGSAQ